MAEQQRPESAPTSLTLRAKKKKYNNKKYRVNINPSFLFLSPLWLT